MDQITEENVYFLNYSSALEQVKRVIKNYRTKTIKLTNTQHFYMRFKIKCIVLTKYQLMNHFSGRWYWNFSVLTTLLNELMECIFYGFYEYIRFEKLCCFLKGHRLLTVYFPVRRLKVRIG